MNADKIKKAVTETLPKVEKVIAYGQGFDAAHSEPCFVTKPEQVEELILNPLCEYNLASYLPANKKRKVGVVVKGCDCRTIVQFLQEGLINRENVVIIGVPCTGVVSAKKLSRALDHQQVEAVRFEGDTIIAKTAREKRTRPCGHLPGQVHDLPISNPPRIRCARGRADRVDEETPTPFTTISGH